LIITGVKLPERVQRELIRGENARATFAIAAQRHLKEAMDRQQPAREVKGLGRKIATIHPELAARLRVRDTASVGRDPFCDPDYMRLLLKNNPFLRVVTEPARLAIRVDGFRDAKEEGGRRKEEYQSPGASAGMGVERSGNPATPNLGEAADRTPRPTTCSGHVSPAGALPGALICEGAAA
jgi:hypothetical protein